MSTLPHESYIKPIRSVLFIDDKFPAFGDEDHHRFDEHDRAQRLWRHCRDQGWACDIDNRSKWTNEVEKRRLSSCDLLILDFHLDGDGSGEAACEIVRSVSQNPSPNLIIIYTSESDQDRVLIEAACAARGIRSEEQYSELSEDYEIGSNLEFEWSTEDIVGFLGNEGRKWKVRYAESCREGGIAIPKGPFPAAYELTRHLKDEYQVRETNTIREIQKIQTSEDRRWFQCGNLFVVIVQKPTEYSDAEVDVLFDRLRTAIEEWSPPWLACLVAKSRQKIEQGSFARDIDQFELTLEDGFTRYIMGSFDAAVRSRRAWEIAKRLLEGRFADAADSLSKDILSHAPSDGSFDTREAIRLNAWMSTERFRRHHLQPGTLFSIGNNYFVCVSPACDMEPRIPAASINPWGARLMSVLPMLALELHLIKKEKHLKEILDETAEYGRHLFFMDHDEPRVSSCFNLETGDYNPRLEQMYLPSQGRVNDDGKIEMFRIKVIGDAPNFYRDSGQVICQVRSPYTERLTHIVGHHLSRVGLNMVTRRSTTPRDDDGHS